jgi:hypothetical protein
MERNRYKIEDIIIGDSIYFQNETQSNHDLYWKVEEKLNGNFISVRVNEMGVNSRAIINVIDIIAMEPRIKQ